LIDCFFTELSSILTTVYSYDTKKNQFLYDISTTVMYMYLILVMY